MFGVKKRDEDTREFVHILRGDDARQRHGDRQLSLVADHRHKLDQSLEAVHQSRLGQRLELCALLEDLGEDLHEGRPRLGISVVAQRCNKTSNQCRLSRMQSFLNPLMPIAAKTAWQFWWYFSSKSNFLKIFQNRSSELYLQFFLKYFANLCFIPKLFSKVWYVQTTLVK